MSTNQPTNNNPTQSTPSTSINYAPIIQGANSALKAMENDRLSAQKDKEHADQRLAEHYAGVKNLGVDPEKLEETITEKDVELFEDMVATVELIPAEYRKRFIDRVAFEAAVRAMERSIDAQIFTGDLHERAVSAIDRANLILYPPAPVETGEGAEDKTLPGEVD